MRSRDGFPNLNEKTPDGIKSDGSPYRVIVVDDKEFHRKQIAQILESEGYEIVATAGNGKEALDKLEKQTALIDLVTTNLDMPIVDGYALTYQLTQKEVRPKVVFISEDTTKGVMKDLISMGISDFILKPINRRIVLERIRQAMLKAHKE